MSFNYLTEQKAVVTQVQDRYRASQSLYEKHFLQQKAQCYLSHSQPQKYYQCIEQVEQALEANAKYMESKFNQIEMKEKECQEECKVFFREDLSDKIDSCMAKCIQNQKQSAFGVYDAFY